MDEETKQQLEALLNNWEQGIERNRVYRRSLDPDDLESRAEVNGENTGLSIAVGDLKRLLFPTAV